MARTIIRNQSGVPFPMPAPYVGIIRPGNIAVVSTDVPTTIANLGGADNVNGYLGFEVGDPSIALTVHDPSSASAPNPAVSKAIASTSTVAASSVGGSPTARVQVIDQSDNQPKWSDGTNWYDATGQVVG